MSDKDTIYRQEAIDAFWELDIELRPSAIDAITGMLKKLPPAQPEYTRHEESILTILFEIAKLIIDLQGERMEMTDGQYFNNNDLFNLAEKLGINY